MSTLEKDGDGRTIQPIENNRHKSPYDIFEVRQRAQDQRHGQRAESSILAARPNDVVDAEPPQLLDAEPPQSLDAEPRQFVYKRRGEELVCQCGTRHPRSINMENILATHGASDCQLVQALTQLQAHDTGRIMLIEVFENKHPNTLYIIYKSRENNQVVMFNRLASDLRLLDLEGSRLRLYTFFDLDIEYGHREQLVTDGLFYTGIADVVQCCHCNIQYSVASLLDNTQIIMCLPQCPYARNNVANT